VQSRKSDRPTLPPAFDVAQYAKDSDARIASATPVDPPPRDEADQSSTAEASAAESTARSEIRLVTRPMMAPAMTDEAWARTVRGVPVVVMSAELLKRLPLDHRAGFVVSMMDGLLDLDTLVEVASMPRDEVLRVVRDLHESGVVEFR
jgi:hypothetical protein